MLSHLKEVVSAESEEFPDMFVYDDRSTDNSAEIAFQRRALIATRGEDEVSFIQHEGKFRQQCWDAFELHMRPEEGDWVLAIDADELLTVASGDLNERLYAATTAAEVTNCTSVLLPVPEVFGIDDDGTPLVRTDKLWGTIAGTRLFRYKPGGTFRDKPMGCGSEPTYVAAKKISREDFGLRLMHFGYAREEDQIAKHARYTGLASHGHLDAHVQSIVGPKTLVRWTGPKVALDRGHA
jgi:hypothetical protein